MEALLADFVHVEIVQCVGLTSFRALGMLAILPFESSIAALGLRLSFALCLGILFSEPALAGSDALARQASIPDFIIEFLIGCLISFPCALVVNAFAMGGELLDSMRGQTIGSLYDPLNLSSTSQLGVFSQYWSWTVLLAAGILPQLLVRFTESLSLVPIGTSAHVLAWPRLAIQIIGCCVRSLEGISLSLAPIVAVLLLVELLFGLAARVLPQLSVSNEAFTVKFIVSAVVYLIALPLVPWDVVIDAAMVDIVSANSGMTLDPQR